MRISDWSSDVCSSDLRRRTFRLGWLGGSPAGGEDSSLDWADDGPGPSRAHDGREAYARLLTALRELPRRQREAFTLRVLEEFDVADTARIMKCSEGSVKTHLSRARAALPRHRDDFGLTTPTARTKKRQCGKHGF